MNGRIYNVYTMATIQKWGNSLAVRIPRKLAESMGISEGKQVTVEREGNVLTVRPVRIPRYSLKELLKDMKPFKLSKEDKEWLDMPPVGEEIL